MSNHTPIKYHYIGPKRAGLLTVMEIYEEVMLAPFTDHQIWRSPWESWRSWTQVESLEKLVKSEKESLIPLVEVTRTPWKLPPQLEGIEHPPTAVLPMGTTSDEHHGLEGEYVHEDVILRGDSMFWRVLPNETHHGDMIKYLKARGEWAERRSSKVITSKTRFWSAKDGVLTNGEEGGCTFVCEGDWGNLKLNTRNHARVQFTLLSTQPIFLTLHLTGKLSSKIIDTHRDNWGEYAYSAQKKGAGWPLLPEDVQVKITFDIKRRSLVVSWSDQVITTSFNMIGSFNPTLFLDIPQGGEVQISPIEVGEVGEERERNWIIPSSLRECLDLTGQWINGPLEELDVRGFFLSTHSSSVLGRGVIVSGYEKWPQAMFSPIYGPVAAHLPVSPSPSQLCYLGPEWSDEWVQWADELSDLKALPQHFSYIQPHAEPKDLKVWTGSNQDQEHQVAFETYCKFQGSRGKGRASLINSWDRDRWELLAATGDPYACFLHAIQLAQLKDEDQAKAFFQIAYSAGCALSGARLDEIYIKSGHPRLGQLELLSPHSFDTYFTR